jgi:hypothetical protein
VSEWAETRHGAELRRAGIEKRFTPRKVGVAVVRFEVNPSKPVSTGEEMHENDRFGNAKRRIGF